MESFRKVGPQVIAQTDQNPEAIRTIAKRTCEVCILNVLCGPVFTHTESGLIIDGDRIEPQYNPETHCVYERLSSPIKQ